MTIDDILNRWNAATARERDFWILEAVVGWRWWAVPMARDHPTMRMFKPSSWTPTAREYAPAYAAKILPLDPPDYGGVKPFADADRHMPHVSTSRADAWLVVDAMRNRGYLLRLDQQERDWCAYFRRVGEYVRPVDAFRDRYAAEQVHVCEAICLAALLAVLRDAP